jgi:hypothetical protein
MNHLYSIQLKMPKLQVYLNIRICLIILTFIKYLLKNEKKLIWIFEILNPNSTYLNLEMALHGYRFR